MQPRAPSLGGMNFGPSRKTGLAAKEQVQAKTMWQRGASVDEVAATFSVLPEVIQRFFDYWGREQEISADSPTTEVPASEVDVDPEPSVTELLGGSGHDVESDTPKVTARPKKK